MCTFVLLFRIRLSDCVAPIAVVRVVGGPNVADFGVERAVNLAALNESEIDAHLAALVQHGHGLPKSSESAAKGMVDII